MSEPIRNSSSPERNPWKTAMIGGGAAALIFIATGAVVASFQSDSADKPVEAVVQAPARAASHAHPVASTPPQSIVEDCNRYAAAADRNEMEIAKDGLIGGAIGAGVGAAGGAIAKGGKGAGKGAGIGAIVGAVGGSLYGLNEENRRTESARAAYADCMARRGY